MRNHHRKVRNQGRNLIYTAIFAAFAFLIGVAWFGHPTRAADLGGNCCADLEERIAELEATTARKGNRKVSLTVYGSVNEALTMIRADGQSERRIVSSAIDPSKFGFTGASKTGFGAAGFQIEVGVDPAHDGLTVREAHVWIETAVGRVSLGHTTTATKDVAAMSVANTTVASKMLSLAPHNGTLGLPDVGYNDGRADLVKWTSPTFAGFVASASWQTTDAWDVALRWGGEALGFKAVAGVGYVSAGGLEYAAGSASLMHVMTGAFVNGAVGQPTAGQATKLNVLHMTWQVQGGLERNVGLGGATTAFAEYGEAGDATLISGVGFVPTDGVKFYGAGVVQAIDAAALDLYASWRRYDVSGAPAVDVLMAGARIRF